jgi:hypothetical protein
MKYYKVPIQYRRNFFILLNSYNHYYGIKSELYKKAQEHNKKLEEVLLSSQNQEAMILYFLKEYITTNKIEKLITNKRDKSYTTKREKLRQLFIQKPNIKENTSHKN